jgi:hypothetical protein
MTSPPSIVSVSSIGYARSVMPSSSIASENVYVPSGIASISARIRRSAIAISSADVPRKKSSP